MLLSEDPARAFVPYPPVPVRNAAGGPLAGLSFGVKDLFDVAGYPTGAGNPLMLARSGIKTRTATIVTRLLEAGARFVGKTHTDELAYSMNGVNAHFGTPRNGGAPDRIPGGSSSGSASAVSNGLCDFAIGTDTGGSVRAPASHCGLFGIRPTHGRVPLLGAVDLSPSFDTCGFFCREIATFARVAAVMLEADAAPLPPRIRLLLPRDAWALIEGPAAEALRGPRRRVEEAAGGAATEVDVALDSFDAMYWSFRYLQGREALQVHGAFIDRDAPPLGPGVRERFAFARGITDAQVAESTRFRARFRDHAARLLGADGVLLLPTMPDTAPRLRDDDAALETYRNAALRLLCIAGLAGFPQLSLPLASREGAPLGLSLLGPPGSDASLVAIAASVVGVPV